MARKIAIECLEVNELDWCTVQLSYAIGVARPMAIYINSNKGALEPAPELYERCEPNNIIKEFNLRKFDYTTTARFGHFGLNVPWEI